MNSEMVSTGRLITDRITLTAVGDGPRHVSDTDNTRTEVIVVRILHNAFPGARFEKETLIDQDGIRRVGGTGSKRRAGFGALESVSFAVCTL